MCLAGTEGSLPSPLTAVHRCPRSSTTTVLARYSSTAAVCTRAAHRHSTVRARRTALKRHPTRARPIAAQHHGGIVRGHLVLSGDGGRSGGHLVVEGGRRRAEAEQAMLNLYCERAQLKNGQVRLAVLSCVASHHLASLMHSSLSAMLHRCCESPSQHSRQSPTEAQRLRGGETTLRCTAIGVWPLRDCVREVR
jgi:hypothetical protein